MALSDKKISTQSAFLTCLLTLFLMMASAGHAETQLYEATYKGKYSGIGITMVKRLVKSDEGFYQLHAEADNFLGSISETSTFIVSSGHIVPALYEYKRAIFGKSSEQRLLYDWDKNSVAYTRSDKPEKNKQFELHSGVLDPSLYQLKLQQELAHGVKHFKLTFAKDSRIKTNEFKIQGETHYKLKNVDYPAVIIERVNQPDDSNTLITVIPKLGHMIAEIEHEDDGTRYQIHLSDVQISDNELNRFYESIDAPVPR